MDAITIATIALWFSGSSLLLAGASFALNFQRWIENGPRLVVSVLPDMMSIPPIGEETAIGVFATNRGLTPTNIQSCNVISYRNWVDRCLDKQDTHAVIIDVGKSAGFSGVPFRLEVHGTWTGRIEPDGEMNADRAKGRLYVAIYAAHRRRPYMRRVSRKRATPYDIADQALAGATGGEIKN